MDFKTSVLTFALLALTAVGALAATGSDDDDDTPRRWAVTVGMGLSCPTATNDTQQGTVFGKAASFGSPGFSIMAERYLPGTNFSVVGGYASEEVDFFGGDVAATMHNIMVGARYYPLSPLYAVQPYAQLSALVNVGEASQEGSLTCSGSSYYNYRRDYSLTCPRVSAVPVVGLDVYILSSLALELQYGYALALGGKAHIRTMPSEQELPDFARSNMHRHSVSIGLKFTFPFRLTESDGCNIIDMLFGVYEADRSHETKSEKKQARLKRVLDSY